jgi:hypothetical protein
MKFIKTHNLNFTALNSVLSILNSLYTKSFEFSNNKQVKEVKSPSGHHIQSHIFKNYHKKTITQNSQEQIITN